MNLCAPGSTRVLKAEKDGKLKSMYLVLLGAESQKAQWYFQRSAAANIEDDDSEESIKRQARLLAQLTVGGEIYHKGEWINVKDEKDMIYKAYCQVASFRQQAMAHIQDLGNYLDDGVMV